MTMNCPVSQEKVGGGMAIYVIGYVDYIDRFGIRHRCGYGRRYEPAIDDKTSPAYYTETGEFRLEDYEKRSNLPFILQAGYNYDRERKKNEGKDWD